MLSDTFLCELCRPLFSTFEGLQALIGPQGYSHHSQSDLTISAHNGCKLCILILNACTKEGIVFQSSDERVILWESCGPPIRSEKYLEMNKHPLLQEELHSIVISTGFESMLQARLVPLASLSMSRLSDYSFSVHDFSIDSAACQYIEGRPIVPDLSGHLVAAPVRKLLEECFSLHKNCPDSKTPPSFLPTRLIDIEIPRISDTDGMVPAPYVALSYCWGGPQVVTASKAAIEIYRKQLPMDKLPPTIIDAIEVTRNLGLRYLWIDALCILQDSDEDKAVEIARMGKIYKNAILTIAATCSPSASEGFLWERPAPPSCRLNLHLPNGDLAEMYIAEPIFDEEKRPLDNRGWTFQESTFSPRLLMFGTRNVTWRCSTKNSETIVGAPNERFIHPSRLPELFKEGIVPEQKYQSGAWRSFIIDYSPRMLTFPSDRLSAIAGVAAEFGTLYKDTYLAGMWQKTLQSDLGWYRSMDRMQGPECRSLGLGLAPSWSWAKMEQGFIEQDTIVDSDIDVIDANIDWLPTLNGSVAGTGWLRLQGTTVDLSALNDSRFVGLKQTLDEENATLSSGTKCLYLGSSFAPRLAIGLLLEPVPGGNYRRVGQFRISVSALDLKMERPFVWAEPEAKRETIFII